MVNLDFLQIVRAKWAAGGGKKRVSFASSGAKIQDLVYVRGLTEEGRPGPVIDRCILLELMAGAHRCAETGQKSGNTVVTVAYPLPR